MSPQGCNALHRLKVLAEISIEAFLYSFYMQEPESGKVKTYPRLLEGVVRQADTTRMEGRARKKQRKQEERAKMEAEIQRLKTLKRREIENRYKTAI